MNDSFPPVIDGVANAVVNYAEVIQHLGSAIVVTPKYPGVTDDYDFPVLRYRSFDTTKLVGYRAGYPFSVSAIKELKNRNLDIIHTHCPVVSSFFARTLREAIDVPLVFTYHTKFNFDVSKFLPSEHLQKTAIRLMLNNIVACDEVWVVSDVAGENLRSLGYTGDYVVMRNGADFPKGRVPEEKVAELRASHGIPDGCPVLLFVGRHMWYKGIKIILDGLAITKASGLDFKMIFVGDGVDRPEIEEYAENAGIKEKCIFTGAIEDRELLRTYFCCADLFLFPSSYDTNGIVVREAAACALASVLIKGSGASEGVEDGVTGILIDENAEAFAEALKPAIENLEFLKQLGKNAQDILYFSWDDSVRLAYDRYGVVIDNYRKGSQQPIKSDEFFASMAEICGGIERARSLRPHLRRSI